MPLKTELPYVKISAAREGERSIVICLPWAYIQTCR